METSKNKRIENENNSPKNEIEKDNNDFRVNTDVDQLYQSMIIKIVVEKKTDEELMIYLQDLGLNHETSQNALKITHEHIRKTLNSLNIELAGKYFLIGVGVSALGGILTWASYSRAFNGGHYLVFTGLFVIGTIYFFRSAYKFLLYLNHR